MKGSIETPRRWSWLSSGRKHFYGNVIVDERNEVSNGISDWIWRTWFYRRCLSSLLLLASSSLSLYPFILFPLTAAEWNRKESFWMVCWNSSFLFLFFVPWFKRENNGRSRVMCKEDYCNAFNGGKIIQRRLRYSKKETKKLIIRL